MQCYTGYHVLQQETLAFQQLIKHSFWGQSMKCLFIFQNCTYTQVTVVKGMTHTGEGLASSEETCYQGMLVCNWQDHALPSTVTQDLHKPMVTVIGRGLVTVPDKARWWIRVRVHRGTLIGSCRRWREIEGGRQACHAGPKSIQGTRVRHRLTAQEKSWCPGLCWNEAHGPREKGWGRLGRASRAWQCPQGLDIFWPYGWEVMDLPCPHGGLWGLALYFHSYSFTISLVSTSETTNDLQMQTSPAISTEDSADNHCRCLTKMWATQ